MTPDRASAAKAHGYDTPTPRPFSVCHGCGDVTRRQIVALEAELREERAARERLQVMYAAQGAEVERLSKVHSETRSTLDFVADRMDDFAYDEISAALIDGQRVDPETGYEVDSPVVLRLRAAEAERDQARAALARVLALADDMDERGRPGAADSAADTASRRQIREDVKRLRAALTPTTGTEQPS